MKSFILALAFVLFGSVAWANPIAQGAIVSDQQLAQVKGGDTSFTGFMLPGIFFVPLIVPR